jgi:hypothetical protein
MDLNLNMDYNQNIDFIELQKMSFIWNALNNDWTVKKKDGKFYFTKKHEGKKEVYLEAYLQKFIESNFQK